ncbi:MAG: noncanonical pyrimidine nucleotidase, YjjG family, partial [Bacteroidetes bacterium]|nr:noncanonical pyrimidine nucleotidase, YjjG family [Bacteroidota bacterium]
MKKYKLILFDADGTLFDFHQGERDALRAAFEHHGMMYEQSVHLPLYQKINLDIWLEFEQHKILA